jgi:hypothetical protein
MSDEAWIKFLVQKFAWGREYHENRGRERSVILKLVFKEKAGRLLNSVVLFRLAMSEGLQPTW